MEFLAKLAYRWDFCIVALVIGILLVAVPRVRQRASGLLVPASSFLVRKILLFVPMPGTLSTADRIIFWSPTAYTCLLLLLCLAFLFGLLAHRIRGRFFALWIGLAFAPLIGLSMLLPFDGWHRSLYLPAIFPLWCVKILLVSPILLATCWLTLILQMFVIVMLTKVVHMHSINIISLLIVIVFAVSNFVSQLVPVMVPRSPIQMIRRISEERNLGKDAYGSLGIWWSKLRCIDRIGVNAIVAWPGDEARNIVVRIGQPAVDPLIRALGSDDWQVRSNAADALGRIGNLRAIAPLVSALSDGDSDVCDHVVSALVRIGQPAVDPLIRALGSDDWRVQGNAAEALGRIGDPKAVVPLVSALGDDDSYVCGQVVSALVRIGQPAVDPLIKALENPDQRVRGNAVDALVRIGEPAVDPLIRTLGSDDWRVRGNAVNALGKIGDVRAKRSLMILKEQDPDPWVRDMADCALKRLREGSVE